jgi:hypothetical protein
MYTYKQIESSLWTVGYADPISECWIAESKHKTPESAAERVHYLNGGCNCNSHQKEEPLFTLKPLVLELQALDRVIADAFQNMFGYDLNLEREVPDGKYTQILQQIKHVKDALRNLEADFGDLLCKIGGKQ